LLAHHGHDSGLFDEFEFTAEVAVKLLPAVFCDQDGLADMKLREMMLSIWGSGPMAHGSDDGFDRRIAVSLAFNDVQAAGGKFRRQAFQ
jgi:hypothetical protein